MQFKIISALALATLAAAGALPRADTDSNPPSTNHGTTNPANTNPANTNPSNTNPSNTNKGTTNQGAIAPPFPGTPLPTIGGSKCSAGHLRCCKSAQSPDAPAVAPLLPSGIPASSISGLVGVTCAALPAGAQPNACSDKPVCCTDNSHGDTISLGCNLVDLSM